MSYKTVSKREINATENGFFENSNKTEASIGRLIKKKREKIQIFYQKREQWDHYKLYRAYKENTGIYEQLYASKSGNLDEMDEYLERHKLPELTPEETDALNSLRSVRKFNLWLKKLLHRETFILKSNFTVKAEKHWVGQGGQRQHRLQLTSIVINNSC